MATSAQRSSFAISASDESNLDAFYNKISSLVCSILKHNVLIIGGDINAQIGKNVNNKFSSHDLTNRNGENIMDFTLENGLTCLNTKFQKGQTLDLHIHK